MSRSPRLTMPQTLHDDAQAQPATGSEIDALIELAQRLGAQSVAIGHGRDDVSCTNAARFSRQWKESGGSVLVEVSWPEEAASWLRQARKLVTLEPDMWVLGGAAVGLAQMTRRLAWSTPWQPARTLALGSSTVHETVRLAGARVLEGMCGAHPGGVLWQIRDDGMENLNSTEIERNIR